MKRLKWILIIVLAVLLVAAIAFFSFASIIVFPPEVGKLMQVKGITYLAVRKPSFFQKPVINLGEEAGNLLAASVIDLFLGRGVKLPWYADGEYISANAFFAYNTKSGVILEKDFFKEVRFR